MSEVAFLTREEAEAFVKENKLATTIKRTGYDPVAEKNYPYTEDNVQPRGVVWVVVDDQQKASTS